MLSYKNEEEKEKCLSTEIRLNTWEFPFLDSDSYVSISAQFLERGTSNKDSK